MLTGKDCRICRIILGYTQEQMGNLMYVTKQTISDIETGTTTKQSSILLYQLVLEKLAETDSDLQSYLDVLVLLDRTKDVPKSES